MFIDNKYTKWYFQLMKCGFKEKQDFYCERHHIVPKSLGGSNSKKNLVYLTARQHYIAHLLLVKMTTATQKRSMSHALIRFAGKNQKKGYKITSRLYETIRKEYSESISGKNNPMYGKPCHYNMSPERKQCWKDSIRDGVTGDKNPFFNKTHSERTRKHISDIRSQPILVKFIDGTKEEFSQYKFLGPYLGMSEHLGSKLCKPQYQYLWSKYNIKEIIKL